MCSGMTTWWRLLAFVMLLGTTAGASRPNLLLILVDDLGYGDLSCYGARDMRTPHLDRLAADGMTFTNFYANCPVCSPTRAALLTGRYQDLVGVQDRRAAVQSVCLLEEERSPGGAHRAADGDAFVQSLRQRDLCKEKGELGLPGRCDDQEASSRPRVSAMPCSTAWASDADL